MNGDQLQYELDNAGVPLDQRSEYPFCSFDADDWANAFCLQNPGFDVDVARAWFASALMRGFDEHACRQQSEISVLRTEMCKLQRELDVLDPLHRIAMSRPMEPWWCRLFKRGARS